MVESRLELGTSSSILDGQVLENDQRLGLRYVEYVQKVSLKASISVGPPVALDSVDESSSVGAKVVSTRMHALR